MNELQKEKKHKYNVEYYKRKKMQQLQEEERLRLEKQREEELLKIKQHYEEELKRYKKEHLAAYNRNYYRQRKNQSLVSGGVD